ncbi:MAG: SEC-C metal-binding domain-containing protein [Candidatus Aminicenantaceae bacterium]
MAKCLDSGKPARDYPRFMATEESRSKIGRNQPCSCGSGEKYKNCCGRSTGR